jgi:hypothetical protein
MEQATLVGGPRAGQGKQPMRECRKVLAAIALNPYLSLTRKKEKKTAPAHPLTHSPTPPTFPKKSPPFRVFPVWILWGCPSLSFFVDLFNPPLSPTPTPEFLFSQANQIQFPATATSFNTYPPDAINSLPSFLPSVAPGIPSPSNDFWT